MKVAAFIVHEFIDVELMHSSPSYRCVLREHLCALTIEIQFVKPFASLVIAPPLTDFRPDQPEVEAKGLVYFHYHHMGQERENFPGLDVRPTRHGPATALHRPIRAKRRHVRVNGGG